MGQIYQLPDWRLVFLVKNFPVGQRVLVDSSSGQSATQGDGKKEEVTRQGEIPLVKEVALVALGNNRSRPYLLVSFSPGLISISVLDLWKTEGPCCLRSTWRTNFWSTKRSRTTSSSRRTT